jgi:hypothetical protein
LERAFSALSSASKEADPLGGLSSLPALPFGHSQACELWTALARQIAATLALGGINSVTIRNLSAADH